MTRTIETITPPPAPHAAGIAGVTRKARRVVAKCLETLVLWQERASQRHALGEMNEHMLKDLGISRTQAEGEAGKPFWMR